MSDCNEALHELYEFLDGELTDERRALIAHHLDLCSPCLEVFDFHAELRSVVARRCQERVPDDLMARISAAVGGECPTAGAKGAGGASDPAAIEPVEQGD